MTRHFGLAGTDWTQAATPQELVDGNLASLILLFTKERDGSGYLVQAGNRSHPELIGKTVLRGSLASIIAPATIFARDGFATASGRSVLQASTLDVTRQEIPSNPETHIIHCSLRLEPPALKHESFDWKFPGADDYLPQSPEEGFSSFIAGSHHGSFRAERPVIQEQGYRFGKSPALLQNAYTILRNTGFLSIVFQPAAGGYNAAVSWDNMKKPAAQFFPGTLESISKPVQDFACAAYAADTRRVITQARDVTRHMSAAWPFFRQGDIQKDFMLSLQTMWPALVPGQS